MVRGCLEAALLHEVVSQTTQIYKAYRPCLLSPEVQSVYYRLSLYLSHISSFKKSKCDKIQI